MKVLEYKILCENTINELTIEVNKYIENGWQPLGPMVMGERSKYQTLVKYERYNRKVGPY